jgi:hypothetical protein
VSLLGRIYRGLEEPDHLQGLFALRQGAGPQDEGLSAEQNGRWWDALTLYELKSRAPAGATPLFMLGLGLGRGAVCGAERPLVGCAHALRTQEPRARRRVTPGKVQK